MLLEHIGSEIPDLHACAIVAKAIRSALFSGFRQLGLENEIPEEISGHTATGSPSPAPHLAIVPMPFVGFPHADGRVTGFALVPPRSSEILERDSFRKALGQIAPLDGKRRVLTVNVGEGKGVDRAFCLKFSLSTVPPANKHSLDPRLYLGCDTQHFSTVTPILLDRHLKGKGEDRQHEMKEQITSACCNIGLPKPDRIFVDKRSAEEGAPSAYPSGKSPARMGWRLPSSLASRQLTHAVVSFAEPVAGPVLLGAGRFVGLGLCRPRPWPAERRSKKKRRDR